MRTEELINRLALDCTPVPHDSGLRRVVLAAGAGGVGALLLMAVTLEFRPDLLAATGLLMFWGKLAFTGWIAVASLLVVRTLSVPGEPPGRAPLALAVPPLAMWGAGAAALATASPDQRAGLLLGDTWAVCPFLIAMLAVPVFLAIVWAMRGLAPTRLRLAGAAVGLFAGATGALVYSLHCPEMAAPFVGTWYLLGMLIPAVAGAALGPRLLRW
jgi:hypothetical protein